MLDPKVAEEARQAWDKFMQQVNRMECRMLTAMADQIDKQWADMAAPVAVPAVPRHDEPTCCGRQPVTEAQPVDAAADETSQVDSLRAEITALKAEVERLRLEGCDLRKSLFAVHDDLGRVWLTKKEKKAVQFAVDHFGTFKSQANTLREIIERLGGGE